MKSFYQIAALKFGVLLIAALMIGPLQVVPALAATACTAVPQTGCKRPFIAQKSSMVFAQTGRTDPDDIYTWKWQHGSQTTLADFGDPLTTTDYVLCIFDQSSRAQPVVENAAPAPTGWKRLRTGFFRNFGETRPLRRASLHAGTDGKARIVVHGDSDTVRAILPFVPPVVVQLQASNGQCWETSLVPPTRNDPHIFRATD